jgi:hypothetical protein
MLLLGTTLASCPRRNRKIFIFEDGCTDYLIAGFPLDTHGDNNFS